MSSTWYIAKWIAAVVRGPRNDDNKQYKYDLLTDPDFVTTGVEEVEAIQASKNGVRLRKTRNGGASTPTWRSSTMSMPRNIFCLQTCALERQTSPPCCRQATTHQRRQAVAETTMKMTWSQPRRP